MRDTEVGTPAPPLEIGIVIGNVLDTWDDQAVASGCAMALERLTEWFGDFRWRLTLHRRPDWGMTLNVEPTHWLQLVSQERDADHWDFGITITNLDLSGHYRPFAMLALSRPLDSAVISTLRLDPDQSGLQLSSDTRIECIANRVCRLILHATGHLNGLPNADEASNVMYQVASTRELDGPFELSEPQRQAMQRNLAAVADVRLEEQNDERELNRKSKLGFYFRAAWINRRDILRSVLGARPHEFPRRLTRLTTAAVSTVTVMLLTTEAWDLALSQSAPQVFALFCLSLVVTSLYVVFRQRLLVPMTSRITEQQVTAQIASVLIVFCGMLTLWCCATILSASVGFFLFDVKLIAQWAGEKDWHSLASYDGSLGVAQLYLRMSTFVASVGISIGALGAGFENQAHFRHILFVDEEL